MYFVENAEPKHIEQTHPDFLAKVLYQVARGYQDFDCMPHFFFKQLHNAFVLAPWMLNHSLLLSSHSNQSTAPSAFHISFSTVSPALRLSTCRRDRAPLLTCSPDLFFISASWNIAVMAAIFLASQSISRASSLSQAFKYRSSSHTHSRSALSSCSIAR